jgi:four helix bundle protein
MGFIWRNGMRDHRKLRAFQLADEVVLGIYRGTAKFPKHEQYGLASQMRRAAISVASNIVESSSRTSGPEYASRTRPV